MIWNPARIQLVTKQPFIWDCWACVMEAVLNNYTNSARTGNDDNCVANVIAYYEKLGLVKDGGGISSDNFGAMVEKALFVPFYVLSESSRAVHRANIKDSLAQNNVVICCMMKLSGAERHVILISKINGDQSMVTVSDPSAHGNGGRAKGYVDGSKEMRLEELFIDYSNTETYLEKYALYSGVPIMGCPFYAITD